MSRVIRKSQYASAHEAADLLAALFTAEIACPSKCLWLISPWISDVALLDNNTGGFDALARFGKRQIHLAEILVVLADKGTTVVVGTTTDEHNKRFLDQLQTLAGDLRVEKRLRVVIDPSDNLHTKALTGDDYALAGSMNITFNGIQVREEYVDLRTDEAFVAQARMDAYDRFGGLL